MRDTQLPAKLTRPRLHSVLRRERLYERLDENAAKPLTWVAGPPGAGKTALVASYVENGAFDHLWFQADPGDGEVATFFYYLGYTQTGERGHRKQPLPPLTSEYRNDIPGYARHFFRLLYERLTTPFIIVLDNYHDLPADSPIHALLCAGIEEAPEGVRWLVVSRLDPPRQYARLEAAERLAFVDSQALALTHEETRHMLALRHCDDAKIVEALHNQCGGWAAGLILTFERLRRLGSMSHSVVTEAKESVFNYFAQEVFEAASERERSLLTRSAVLPRMTVDMVQQLTEDPQAEAVLDHLYRRRLFVEKRRQTYQFHDLFRAFLLARLVESCDSKTLGELNRRAAQLLQLSGAVEDAFDLYCEAEDWGSAEQTILKQAAFLLEQGRSERLKAWIARLPKGRIPESPWLQYWLGMSLLQDAPPKAREPLESAFRKFSASKDLEGQLLSCAAMVVTYYFDYAEMKPLDPWIDAMLSLVEALPASVSPEIELRLHLALLFALRHRRPDRRLMTRFEMRTADLIGADCLPNTRMLAAIMLLAGYAAAGDVEQGEGLIARMAKQAENLAVTPANRANWRMIAGHFLLMSGSVEAAAESFDAALSTLEKSAVNLEMAEMLARFGLGLCALDDDRIEIAQTHAHALVALSERIRPLTEACANRLQIRIALRQGDPDRALRHALSAHVYSSTAGTTMGLIIDKLDVTRSLIALERHEEASTYIDEGRELCRDTMFFRYACMFDLFEAYAAIRRGAHEESRALLARGLKRSRVDAYCHTRLSYPEVYAVILTEAWKACLEEEYVTKLIRQIRLQPPKGVESDWPWHIRIRTLGQFEIVRDDKALEFGRKTPQKPLQLLKALIALGGTDVSEQRLSDALWEGDSGDDSGNLQVTLNRLRKLIGRPEAIRQRGGKLSLDPDLCWADAIAFDRLAGSNGNGTAAASVEKALQLYRGAFLDGDEEAPWLIGTRERLRTKFVSLVVNHGRVLEAGEHYDAAIALYQRGIDAEELAEDLYRGLMRCFGATGRVADAMIAYRRLRLVLSVSLGIPPSAETQALFESLRQ